MMDPGSSDWNKLSPEVKRVIRLAEAIASNAKMNQVTAAHIMLALIRTFPLQVRKTLNIPLDQLKKQLENDYIYNYNLTRLKFVIRAAIIRADHGIVKLHHLIEVTSNYISVRGKSLDIDKDKLRSQEKGTPKYMGVPLKKEKEKQRPDPFLNRLGRDLTQLAINGKLHPIIGRDKEINLVAETLCRVFKRNPLLVGPAGAGKTAIVEGLAQRLESEDIAPELKKKRIIEMDVGNLVKGTKYRGELEKKIMQIIDRVKNSHFIIFIDELHTLMGAGLAEGTTLDVTSMLLPSLARGEISCIGATTDYNYHKFIEKDKAFERRFQPIRIPELSPEDTLRMLKEIGPIKFEKPKNIEIDQQAYHASLDLAGRYMRNRYFPDKAIDIIDHAVGRAIRKKDKKVTVSDIKNIMGSLTGLPIGKLEDELKNKLKGLTSHLKEHILGQDHVADIVADTIWPKTLGADLHPERPNGIFLFVGPTGVGKTEFARELARYLFGSLDKLIRIDMSEYSESQSHTVAKLLGAPFGYR
ncbi:MAG: AAA family ATPase, partial [Candidatus Aminicenantes bacterium]|nr:AAA family ATPase [Candidatus Aminicenantes bacterium]